MKIKNISNQVITILFDIKDSKSINLSLQPNQVVYCEDSVENNKQVVIYKRKNKIELTNDDKPKNGHYYHPYGVLPHAEVLKLKNQIVENIPIIEIDEEENIEPEDSQEVEILSLSDTEMENEDLEKDDVNYKLMTSDDETSKPKNKGGRPKGSMGKKKPGRVKKKKPIGRPKKKVKEQQKQKIENIGDSE